MRFRPCIDIHNGAVKQIVGGSLKDEADFAKDNFVSELKADFYADLYRRSGLVGGHIILLNPAGSTYYEADLEQAKLALAAYPQGLQIGGGINADNAEQFLDMGARQVIVTSYVFKDGRINYENLKRLSSLIGAEHLVLDLSCRKKDGRYYIVTDRWQKFTEEEVTLKLMEKLGAYCDEFLIHAVDVEGKAKGIEVSLAKLLGEYNGHPVTYAGGVGSMEDIQNLKMAAGGKVDVTVGSALDLFGGTIPFEKLIGNL